MADEAQNPDQTPQTVPPASEPAQPVSEPTPAPATPEQTAQPETPTAQTPVNEPIDIPPFDNSPAPLPQTPAPAQAPQARSGRDLLVKARQTIQDRKQKKLQKVLDLFAKKDKITNDEVEKLLHVSDATATRYLSALEKQGAIRQVGKTGHAVSYTKI
jgi:hypothetical protein